MKTLFDLDQRDLLYVIGLEESMGQLTFYPDQYNTLEDVEAELIRMFQNLRSRLDPKDLSHILGQILILGFKGQEDNHRFSCFLPMDYKDFLDKKEAHFRQLWTIVAEYTDNVERKKRKRKKNQSMEDLLLDLAADINLDEQQRASFNAAVSVAKDEKKGILIGSSI